MALSVVIRKLSGSTDMLPIAITGTVTAQTTDIHSTVSGTNIMDQLFVYASHTSSNSITVFTEFGPTSNTLIDEVPGRAVMYPLFNGNIIQGHTAATATIIKMYVSTTNIHIYGHVNRSTET